MKMHLSPKTIISRIKLFNRKRQIEQISIRIIVNPRFDLNGKIGDELKNIFDFIAKSLSIYFQ